MSRTEFEEGFRNLLEVMPHLTVEAIQENGSHVVVTGTIRKFNRTPHGLSHVWVSTRDAVVGVLEKPEGPDDRVKFQVASSDFDERVEIGAILPWMSGYWNRHHVRMILEGRWREREFEPRDAIHFRLGGSRGWGPVEGGIPEGAEKLDVVAGGWDHEHCEICMEKIGAYGQAGGYVDEEDHWICSECYRRYAAPRSLEFLRE